MFMQRKVSKLIIVNTSFNRFGHTTWGGSRNNCWSPFRAVSTTVWTTGLTQFNCSQSFKGRGIYFDMPIAVIVCMNVFIFTYNHVWARGKRTVLLRAVVARQRIAYAYIRCHSEYVICRCFVSTWDLISVHWAEHCAEAYENCVRWIATHASAHKHRLKAKRIYISWRFYITTQTISAKSQRMWTHTVL